MDCLLIKYPAHIYVSIIVMSVGCRQLLCRHYRVYFPVRQHLVQHMVSSIQRLGLTPNATIEQRRLAVDLAEVIIKWEFQRVSTYVSHCMFSSTKSLAI
jgi:hypothetical protein